MAIIAILAGMLLPALNKARAKARKTDCLNRHKSLGTMILSYANDYDDTLLFLYKDSGTLIDTYLQEAYSDQMEKMQVACTENTPRKSDGKKSSFAENYTAMYECSGSTSSTFNRFGTYDTTDKTTIVKMSRVKSSSNKIVFCDGRTRLDDCFSYTKFYFSISSLPSSWGAVPWASHGSRDVVTSFLDGHAAATPFKNFQDMYHSSTQFCYGDVFPIEQ